MNLLEQIKTPEKYNFFRKVEVKNEDDSIEVKKRKSSSFRQQSWKTLLYC